MHTLLIPNLPLAHIVKCIDLLDMIIHSCLIHLELPHVHSLKGRRSIINSLKEKLKAFNLSVLDVSGEYPKEADIAFAFLSPDAKHGMQYLQKIEAMIERHFGEYVWEVEHEVL